MVLKSPLPASCIVQVFKIGLDVVRANTRNEITHSNYETKNFETTYLFAIYIRLLLLVFTVTFHRY